MDNSNFRWFVSAAAVAAVAAVAVYSASAGAYRPYMDGKLSVKHSSMEWNCASCHTPWKGVTDKACTRCHENKKHAAGKNTGKAATTGDGCFSCHREHKGRFWNIKLVENDKCRTCHVSEMHPALKKSAVDPHNPNEFGIDCGKCHVKVKHPGTMDLSTEFNGLGKKGFSHGKHLQRDNVSADNCDICHEKSEGDGPFKMAGLENACGACHSMYGGNEKSKPASVTENCPACHISGDASTIESLKTRKPMKAFAHSKHGKYKCLDCHDGAAKSDVVTDFMPVFTKCMDCHKEKMVSNECGTCHTFHSRMN